MPTRDVGKVRDTIVAALWILFAPICVFAPKASVVFLIIFALAIPDHRAAARGLRNILVSWFGAFLAGFVIWALVSSTWSPSPVDALSASLRFTAVMLVGLLVFAATRIPPSGAAKRTAVCMAATPFLIALILGVEIATDGFFRSLLRPNDKLGLVFASRGSATLAILALAVPPLLFAQLRSVWAPVALVAVAFAAIVPLPMTTSLFALSGGLAVGVLVWVLGPVILRIFAAFVIVVAVASPWIFTNAITQARLGDDILVELPTSFQHRLGIWEFAGTRALERPLFGHGFDASREIDRADSGKVRMVTPGFSWEMERMPLHPHSFAFQVWLEMGLVGICLFCGGLLALVRAVGRSSGGRAAMAANAAALTAALTFMFVSFGAWQSWWVATLWLMAVVCGTSMAAASGRAGPSGPRAA